MANKLYDETSIQNIANAIRNKNGSLDLYNISEMAQAIDDIPTGPIIEGEGSKVIYITDAVSNKSAISFSVENATSSSTIVVTNRNLIDFSQIPASQTVNGLTFTNNGANGITINGTTITSDATYIEIPLDPEALQAMFWGDVEVYPDIVYVTVSSGKTTYDDISVRLLINGGGEYGEYTWWSNDEPYWVDGQDIPWRSDLENAVIRIGTEGGSATIDNIVVKPMINFASIDDYMSQTVPEFAPGTRSAFTYSASAKPYFTDTTNYIYSTDTNVEDFQVSYLFIVSDGDNTEYPIDSQ